MNTTLEKTLSALEVRALNKVGLTPQTLSRSLDDTIRRFLWEKAEVDVKPASSSNMVGGTLSAGLSGVGAVLVKEGGVSVGTSFTTGNIKKQTAVQEWIHWKKYALDRPEFEQYREELTRKTEKNYEAMVRYIRSDKGKECVSYQQWRPIARIFTVVLTPFAVFVILILLTPVVFVGIERIFLIGCIAPFIANFFLIKKMGVTLPEWFIQKVLRKRSFASIKPRVQVNDGLLELEY